jgi:hypothetical protein
MLRLHEAKLSRKTKLEACTTSKQIHSIAIVSLKSICYLEFMHNIHYEVLSYEQWIHSHIYHVMLVLGSPSRTDLLDSSQPNVSTSVLVDQVFNPDITYPVQIVIVLL